eukprot:scaffold5037_cov114-Isochrysis_galbana.AAC.17
MARHPSRHILGLGREVGLEPQEDAGEDDGGTSSRRGALGRVVQPELALLVQLAVEPVADVGFGPQVRARDGGAHNGRVDARLGPFCAEHAVLNLGQRELLPSHHASRGVPNLALGCGELCDGGGQRARLLVGCGEQADAQAVVRVDVQRQPLVWRQR